MKNLKIGKKIMVGFGLAIVMMVIIVIAVVISNMSIDNSVNNVSSISDLQTNANGVMRTFNNARVAANQYFLEDDEDIFKSFVENYNEQDVLIKKAPDIIKSNEKALSHYSSEYEKIDKLTDEYHNDIENLHSAYAEAETAYNTISEKGASLITIIDELFETQVQSMIEDFDSGANREAFVSRGQKFSLLSEIQTKLLEMRVSVRQIMTDYDAATAQSALVSYDEFVKLLEDLKATLSRQNNIDQVNTVIETAKVYRASIDNFITVNENVKTITAQCKAIGQEAVSSVESLSAAMDEDMGAEISASLTLSVTSLIIVIVVAVFAIIISVVLSIIISKSITVPVQFLTDTLSKIGHRGQITFSDSDWKQAREIASGKDEVAESVSSLMATCERLETVGKNLTLVANGDLTQDIKALSEDDLMGLTINKMVDNLNGMFRDINNATSEVSSGAGQISDGAQSLAQGSTEQAATVEELSASIADIANKTKENADMANNAASLANEIKANAEKGNAQMAEMTKAVDEINTASQNISKVIKVIDDIAFQTNILALNAAVEAARAGEAGKGFAVVADEVRNLASKSAAAAKETGALIENSMKKAELGAQIAAETALSLNEIVSGINESTVIVGKIADSSEEQKTAIAQINDAIEQVSEVVQRNSATAEQSAASSQELNAQSNILSANVSKFHIKQEINL
jgi:methyl-accepting chemotaxis protein